MGRLKFELILGSIIDHPVDAWVASTGPESPNTDKAASGAIAAIDRAPFDEYSQIIKRNGGSIPFGTSTATRTGPALQGRGVKRVYHSVDYYGFQQIVFFTSEDLLASRFPFSGDDLANYKKLLEDNRDLLAKAEPLFRSRLFSVFQEMVSIDGKATAEEKQIIEQYKAIYKQIHAIIFDYYPHINIETATKSILGALKLVDGDADIHSIALPSIGSGFFGGMSLEDSIGMTVIAAYDYVQRHSQGKEITLKLVIFGHESQKNYDELSKIWRNVLASDKTWKKLADLDSRSPVTARGESGFKDFLQNILGHIAPIVENIQPQPVPAAPATASVTDVTPAPMATETQPKRKGLLSRLCERFLK